MDSPCAQYSWRGVRLSHFRLITTDFLVSTSPSLSAQTNDSATTARDAARAVLTGALVTLGNLATGLEGAVTVVTMDASVNYAFVSFALGQGARSVSECASYWRKSADKGIGL